MEHIDVFLKKLPLFETFSSNELQDLIKRSQLKTFNPYEIMIKFGQPGSFLGVLLTGEAEAVVTRKTGERQRLGLIEPGDLLGEMSLLTGEPTSADVIALEKCEILLIPQEAFSTSLAVNPAAIKVIARTMSERLKNRQQDEKAEALLEEARQSVPDPYGLRLSTATPMKILIINCGSSSLKYGYFDTQQEANNVEGIVERIGLENTRMTFSSKKNKTSRELGSIDHSGALGAMAEMLTDHDTGVINDLNELTVVGHRVVHGGDKYSNAVIINKEVIEDIDKNSNLAPLHNPLNLMGIKEAMKLMPKVPQVAVFDTGFHQNMPPHAYLYGLPYDFYEQERIRKYGFHGISHNYVALQAAAHLKRNFRQMKIISCHLGAGASISAIDHGRSVDTTMGLTPLEGLIMGTRCGDIDPSIVIHLCQEKGLSIEEVDRILNRESGLKGLSGISSDFQELEEAASKGNARALLTIHTFCYRIRKYIGAYMATLGGADALVFTGGIGKGSAWVRSLACQGLSYMGIEVEDVLNRTASPSPREVVDIASEDSLVRVLVIPTDEERMIAREAINTLSNQNTAQIIKNQRDKNIPIEVSAHHVHLSRRDVDILFGPRYELTKRSELSQPGQFACEETLNLLGPKGKVERVRILGPLRKESQVEISMTEEFILGITAPIRASGDLEGSPGVIVEGQQGSCEIAKGVILALRHIHMTPEDALSFGLRDKDIVRVRIEGKRTLTFEDVLVRVDPSYRLSMHIDTDEANAAGITTGMVGHLVTIEARS
jgi:acetate kinase